jgi:subtilisin family serine protease
MLQFRSKIRATLAVAFSIAAAGVFAQNIQIGKPDRFGGYPTDHILVRFKSGQVPAMLRAGSSRTGDASVDRLSARWAVNDIQPVFPQGFGDPARAERLGLSRTYSFNVRLGADVKQMAAQYSSLRNVEVAEIDGIGGVGFAPNDPLVGNCWGLNNTGQDGGTADADVDAFEAWDLWRGATNFVVAICDTGLYEQHVDLVGRKIAGWNTHDNNGDTSDGFGHGTHVAGTIGANGNNSIGVAGMDWNTKIMPVRVLSSGGSGTEAQCAAGIVYAADHGANVVSMSLQYYTGSQAFRDAVTYAWEKNVLLIAATGNNQGHIVAYPAKFPHCAGVGATTRFDTIASFSNYGPETDISAPGEDVLSLWPGNQYEYLSGTSMATPHTSGTAALVFSYDRGQTADEVLSVLTSTAEDKGTAGFDEHFGWGRLNAFFALQKVSQPLVGFTSMNVTRGTLQSGTVGNLFDTDDVRVNMGAKAPAAIATASAQLQAEGAAPNMTFNRLQLLVEGSASASGVMQKVEAFDFVANAWVQLDLRDATTADSFAVVNVTSNPSRFLQSGTRILRARVSYLDAGTGVASWTAKVDQFRGALRND